MNPAYKNCIIDNLLEMFNNVIDHANSNYVYVCGQFFPHSGNLTFSIVDIGRTILENVELYMTENNMKKPDNSLQWAILPGHSTKTEQAPGGLGFSTLLYFLKKNRGEFILISGNEAYELNKNNKDRFNRIEKFFPGTIVTVTINLKDEQAYLYDEATNNVIIF